MKSETDLLIYLTSGLAPCLGYIAMGPPFK